jgi:SSS family solute:Na+ symporter
MAQNFWTAIWAWCACFVATIIVSLLTVPRPEQELVGLVYSMTERPRDDATAWYLRPETLGAAVLGGALILNVVFW